MFGKVVIRPACHRISHLASAEAVVGLPRLTVYVSESRSWTGRTEQDVTAIPRTQLGSTGISVSRFILGAGGIGGVATVTGPGIGLGRH